MPANVTEMTPEQQFAEWGHQAMLTRKACGNVSHMALIAMFEQAHGLLVTRPGYADPSDAAIPQAHYLRGPVMHPTANSLRITASGDKQFTLQPVDELVPDHVREGIAAWRKWVQQQGKAPEDEHQELRRELSGAFGI